MNLLVLAIVLPLLAAFVLQPMERASRLLSRVLGPVTLLVSVALVAWFWLERYTTPLEIAIGGFAPPFGITLYVDELALLFALLVPFTGLLFWSRRNHERQARENGLMLLLLASGTGLALSGDLVSAYVFYELMAVASLGLIRVGGSGQASAASLRYLFISALGSILALLGIVLIYVKAGSVNIADLAHLAPASLNNRTGLAAFALLLLGFGVKAELFPVNAWVAEVYATVPSRIAALLAGVISKLAVIVIVRLLVHVFPQPEAAQLLLVLGMLGLVTGELAAWRAQDMRRMLAFSSIGQLGLIFIAFSLPGSAGVMVGLAVTLHHLVVKPALFMIAEGWGGSLESLKGAAKHSPLAAGLIVLLALSLIGVPPLPGFWAKLLVLTGLATAGAPLQLLALGLILLATVLEAVYLFRVIISMYSPGKDVEAHQSHGRWELLVATLFGVVLLAGMFLIVPVGKQLDTMASQVTISR